MPTNQPLLPEIEKRFPTLPEHIVVIPPESLLSSYTLAQISQAASIYGARMGFEIAALGTPLLVAGQTFNRGKGFSYDFETKEDYFAFLDRLDELKANDATRIRVAKKWAYHFLYRIMMDFPLLKLSSGVHMAEPEFTFDSMKELLLRNAPHGSSL